MTATCFYRYRKDGTVAWYCNDHANRLTNEFNANGDPRFLVSCCKCGTVVTA
jgi:hypothetical protein